MIKANKNILFLLIIFFALNFFVFVNVSEARNLGDAFLVTDESGADPLDTVAGEADYNIDTWGDPDQLLQSTIGTIIMAVLSFAGVIFVILMVYGGFLWMTDRGNEDQVKKAKDLISAAIIGLIIVISAYSISYLVVSKVTSGSLQSSPE